MAAPNSTFLVFDVNVRQRRPLVAFVLGVITLGYWGAVVQYRINDQLRQVGRQRGAMPFPFITVSPGTAVTVWCLGNSLWLACVAVWVYEIREIVHDVSYVDVELITTFASSLLLLAPLWMTALHTCRRIRTAQWLTGCTEPWLKPYVGAVVASIFPPAYLLVASIALRRAWSPWREYAPAHVPPAPQPVAGAAVQ